MAWRNTNPSDYAPKSNAIGDALTGFASVYVPAKIAKDKREAEMAYEKEKADAKAAADAAEKAAAQDKKDKADLRVANSIVVRMAGVAGVDPKSITSKGLSTILDDVKNFGGKDAFDMYLNNSGNLIATPSAFFNTPNTTASVPINTDTGSGTSSTIPITGNAKDADSTIANAENTEDLAKATDAFIDTLPDTNASTNDNLEEIDASEKVDSNTSTSMFSTRLPDLMEAMQKNNTPALASAYYDGLVKKVGDDSRYESLAAEFKQYVDKISMENPSISDLGEFTKLELEAVVKSETVSKASKANATLLLEGLKSDIPWETLNDKNFAGYARKFPDFAKEIEEIAIANTRGIFKPEDIGNFTLAQLKAYETSAIPGIEGYRSLITDTIKQKEQEKYQGISDKSTDELIALTRNTMGYDIDVRIMASNMVSARKMQGFDINTLDGSSIDVLKAMETDTRIPQVNRNLITKLRENKEKSVKTFNSYAKNVTNEARAITALELAKSDNAPSEVITKLTALKNSHTKAKTVSDLLQAGLDVNSIEDAVLTMEDGTKKYIQARVDTENNLLPIDPTDKGKIRLMSAEETKAFSDIRTETQKIFTELGEASNAISEALETSAAAIAIVDNDERTKGVGGGVAKLLTGGARVTGELFSVATDLFKDKPEDHTITIEDIKAKGKFSNDVLNAVISGDVKSLADDTARFQAKMLSLAFQVGRMEGQSGNAMSNQDFRKIMEIVSTSGGAVAFKTNLKEYLNGKINSYDRKLGKATGPGSQVDTFVKRYNYSPISLPLKMDAYVASVGQESLTSAYELIKSDNEVEIVKERPPEPPKDQWSTLSKPKTLEERNALGDAQYYVTPDGKLAYWEGN